MKKSNTILAMFAKTNRIKDIETAFILAEQAKKAGQRKTANALFAWLFVQPEFKTLQVENFQVVWEFCQLEQDAFPYQNLLGYPLPYGGAGGIETLNELVSEFHYHSLITLKFGTYTLCCPAPMLTDWALTKVLQCPKLTIVQRGEHNREIDKSLPFVPVSDLGLHIFDFTEPTNIFI